MTFPGRTEIDPSMKHYGIGDFIHTASNVVGDLQGHRMWLMGNMGIRMVHRKFGTIGLIGHAGG